MPQRYLTWFLVSFCLKMTRLTFAFVRPKSCHIGYQKNVNRILPPAAISRSFAAVCDYIGWLCLMTISGDYNLWLGLVTILWYPVISCDRDRSHKQTLSIRYSHSLHGSSVNYSSRKIDLCKDGLSSLIAAKGTLLVATTYRLYFASVTTQQTHC